MVDRQRGARYRHALRRLGRIQRALRGAGSCFDIRTDCPNDLRSTFGMGSDGQTLRRLDHARDRGQPGSYISLLARRAGITLQHAFYKQRFLQNA
jgi:hypothetical protein